MRAKIFNALKISAIAAVLSVGIAYAFSAPQCTPPGCNANAPLNVGGTSQTKIGTASKAALLLGDYGVTGISTNPLTAGIRGTGGLFGVVGSTLNPGGTGVSGTGDVGVVGIGTVADFYAKNTGVRFPDGSQQKTAVTWKVCEGSNGSTFNEAFMVPPSWTRTDCFNELYYAHISPLSWWRVGCLNQYSASTLDEWGSYSGGVPPNNSCGWDVPPPPDPTTGGGGLFCWKYPDAASCK